MMVKLDVIVTRGGDGGETSLGDGARVRKDALRVEAYGTVDEANAAIGVLRVHTHEDAEADAMLARIQNDLFDIGADLCVPGEAGARLRVACRDEVSSSPADDAEDRVSHGKKKALPTTTVAFVPASERKASLFLEN
jgi:ATP:cob(I)alamin adenosyltransferase